MGMGKRGPFSFRRSGSSSSRRQRATKKVSESPATTSSSSSSPPNPVGAVAGKPKKKSGGPRLWMRVDCYGQTEVFECDKSTIINRAAIPARDLRILGPVFSHSSNILAREKAMVVNLEYIKAIVTAEEVLLLDPLRKEVIPFVDQLRHQLSRKSQFDTPNSQGDKDLVVHGNELNLPAHGQWRRGSEASESLQAELPFEFQVLEIALEVVCTYLDSSVADLERDAYPVLDELAKNANTKNLEHVRSLKSLLTRLLARVQKVRNELEHLLDDEEDMTHLYLTRKMLLNQQSEALLGGTFSNSFHGSAHYLRRFSSLKSGSMLTNNHLNGHDVEDLEMLLEAYFMQLDRTRNKILSVREYVDDTEDYVNIQLDYQRNELIQLQLILTIVSFAVSIETLVAGWFGMNIPCRLYDIDGIFNAFVVGITAASVLLFVLLLGYARWKKLLGP